MDSIAQLSSLEHSNINEKVYQLLKERILSKALVPGQQLNLRQIGDQLGVSRTPLKDALNRLAAEGLVEIKPRRGTYVTAPTLRDVEELFDVRRVLERYAVERAIVRATDDERRLLHQLVAELSDLVAQRDWASIYQRHVELDHKLHRCIVHWSGNRQLARIWEQVNVHVQISRMRYNDTSSQLDVAQQEHERLAMAFETGDVALAKELIDQHIGRTQQLLRQDFA